MITYNKDSLNFAVNTSKNGTDKSFNIALDPKTMRKNKINVTTHGHTDHTPRKVACTMILASDITRKIIEHRLQKNFLSKETFNNDHFKISLKDAGHCLGSRMILIEERETGEKTLYTGDYNTINKYCGAAKPIKCDNLIIDSTYGHPKYKFPSYLETSKKFLDYVRDNDKERIAIVTYSFGKPQEICSMLNSKKIPFSIDHEISDINRKINLRYQYQKDNANVIVTKRKIPHYKNIAMTGFALSKSFKYVSKFDEAFPISDHADYYDGLNFVKKCNPSNVYTLFKYKHTFATEITKHLGIQSSPLSVGQRMLNNFSETPKKLATKEKDKKKEKVKKRKYGIY